MKRIDPKIIETQRDIEKEKLDEMMEDPVYETIMLLADEITGKTVLISNSKFPNVKKTMKVHKVTTDYRPGRSLKNKHIFLHDKDDNQMNLDVPTDIKVKGNRFTLDYSDDNEDRVIMKSFKAKESKYLEVYLEII